MTDIKPIFSTHSHTDRLPEIPQLRKAAKDMESLFVQQMYKAMRATVPDGDPSMNSAGESMFTDLMDEQIAADTPDQWASRTGSDRGLQEAIYKQLCAKL